MSKQYTDVWDALDNAPEYAQAVARLIAWSTNYDIKTGTPYQVFLDLIGYSHEEYGETMVAKPYEVLGYLEMGYLADALKEYADAPSEVMDFVKVIDTLDRE